MKDKPYLHFGFGKKHTRMPSERFVFLNKENIFHRPGRGAVLAEVGLDSRKCSKLETVGLTEAACQLSVRAPAMAILAGPKPRPTKSNVVSVDEEGFIFSRSEKRGET